MPMSDADYIKRHAESLSEARAAAQELGRLADPEYNGSRRHYIVLKDAVEMLEGSARQLGTLWSDARWIRNAAFWGRLRLKLQPAVMMERWAWFGGLSQVFDVGQRGMEDLLSQKTGQLSSKPILPSHPTWAQHPDYRPEMRRVN
jgi:hypothetical protein